MTIIQSVRFQATDRERPLWSSMNGLSDGGNIWFYRELREQREAAGVSQSELARMVGMNHSTMSRYEGGSRFPSREAVDRIVDALEARGHCRRLLYLSAGFWPWSEIPTAAMSDLFEVVLYSGLDNERIQLLRRTIAGLLNQEG